MIATPVGSSVPTPNPALTGQKTRGIPQFLLTPVPGATELKWRITDPDGVIVDEDDGTLQPLAFTTPPLVATQDGVHTLRASDGVGPGGLTVVATFDVDTIGPAEQAIVLSGPPLITGSVAPFAFSWSQPPDTASSEWQLLQGATVLAQGSTVAPVANVAVTTVLPSGDLILNFKVRVLDALGNPGVSFSQPYIFSVDQTPPRAPLSVAGPAGTTRDRTPTFTWQGTELGGSFEWDVTDTAGRSIVGPGTARTTTATTITTPTLPLAPSIVHRLTFHVRQIDPYGNRGPERTIPLTITTVQARGVATRLAQFMTPAAGRRVTNLRPLLRWRKLTAGTTLFNVQIYQGSRKVVSDFSRGTRYKVPAGRLKRGTQYTWHVWSYIGKRKQYVSRPMTSFFTTPR